MNSPKQRVTATDIANGRVRCGVALKQLLPENSQKAMKVVIRGVILEGNWDPRNGPDRNRSGVLSVGRGTLQQLVVADDILSLEIIDGVPHLR
jgi:hypothetical protein